MLQCAIVVKRGRCSQTNAAAALNDTNAKVIGFVSTYNSLSFPRITIIPHFSFIICFHIALLSAEPLSSNHFNTAKMHIHQYLTNHMHRWHILCFVNVKRCPLVVIKINLKNRNTQLANMGFFQNLRPLTNPLYFLLFFVLTLGLAPRTRT